MAAVGEEDSPALTTAEVTAAGHLAVIDVGFVAEATVAEATVVAAAVEEEGVASSSKAFRSIRESFVGGSDA